MSISKEFYENFRSEVIKLLTAESNLLEEDEIMLSMISESKDPEAVIDLARGMKEEGNVLFKRGNVDEALEKYGYAGLVITCFSFEEEFINEVYELLTNTLLNAALCFSKKCEFSQVGLICTVILEFNPDNVKARFRRAMAALELGKRNSALWDLFKASSIDPLNKEVKQKIEQLKGQEGYNHQNDHKRNGVPIGLGMGVPPLKERSKAATVSISNKKGNKEEEKNRVGDVLDCSSENSAVTKKDNEMCCSLTTVESMCLEGKSDEDMIKEDDESVCSSANSILTKDDEVLSCSSTREVSMCMGEKSDEDMIKEDERDLSDASSIHSCMDECVVGDMSHERESPLLNDVPSIQGSDTEESSVEKNKNHAESIYRFVNRQKADSFLSIGSNDYQKLRKGRPLQYYNANAGAFITIQMLQNPQDKSRNGKAMDTNMEVIHPRLEQDNPKAEIDEHLDEEESTITQEEEEQGMEEEVAEASSAITPIDRHQDSLHDTLRNSQYSSTIPRRGRQKQNRKGRRKKSATPQTLFGAGKRQARRRSVFASLTNEFSCRNRPMEKKKRNAFQLPEPNETARKKCKIEGCFSACSAVVDYAISSFAHVISWNNESIMSSLESCVESGLPTPHQLALANPYGE